MLIITYDRNRGDDYGPLCDRLRQLGARHFQLSAWELPGNYSASAVHADLKRHFDAGDRLYVAEVNPLNKLETPLAGNVEQSLGSILGDALTRR